MPVQLVEIRSFRKSCDWGGPDRKIAYDEVSCRFATQPPFRDGRATRTFSSSKHLTTLD